MPTNPFDIENVLRILQRWLKEPYLSDALRHEFEAHCVELTARLHYLNAERAQRLGLTLLSSMVGRDENAVYCAALPKYVEHPDGPNGEVLFKLGMTTKSVYDRTARMQRNAGLPQDLHVYRLYRPDNDRSLRAFEAAVHRTLGRASEHVARNKSVFGGSEWYLSTFEAIDQAAGAEGVSTEWFDPVNSPVIIAPTSNSKRR